jgi:hypothetical protein
MIKMDNKCGVCMEPTQNEGLCTLCQIAKRRTCDMEKKHCLVLSEDDIKGIAQAIEHHAGSLAREKISHSKFRELVRKALLIYCT